ncbi:DNJC9 protein, partial [Casuarius casuarius]|nr:DNJC9 protein [Casuarius casuarius]
DLYRVLGVAKGAAPGEIRRGYRRAALHVHPDRAEPGHREEATRRFQVSAGRGGRGPRAASLTVLTVPTVRPQVLGRAYAVLSDAERRAVYDEQGTVEEEEEEGEALRPERDWQEYWRLLFKKITIKDIEDFEKNYKDSEEELDDIKAAYIDFEGDMDKIMESVLCVDYTDEPRIRKIIQEAIDSGELPAHKAFVKESKQKMSARKRRAEKEAKEAEKTREELGLGDGEDDLKALIQVR